MKATTALTRIPTLLASALLTAALLHAPAHAQAYPAKPVRVIVPVPAGGIVDILARAVTDKIATNWGTPIIVEAKLLLELKVQSDYQLI